MIFILLVFAVLATAKVPNLKANHNSRRIGIEDEEAVLATAKVPNLKANHNYLTTFPWKKSAVLATAKVPNLKANHNKLIFILAACGLC